MLLTKHRTFSPQFYANIVIAGALGLILLLAWHYWQDFVQACINMQIYMHRYLVLYLLQIRNGQFSGGLFLVFSGFIYGFLHAIGPGHGKFVVTTYLSTSRENHFASRLIPFMGSMMQGIVAIIFVYLLAVMFNFSMGDLSSSRWYVERASAIFIGLFGLVTLARALGITPWKKRPHLHIHRISSLPKTAYRLQANRLAKADCGCGHKHLPTQAELNGNWSARLWVILSIGIRPCSGAILVLVFANAIGMFRWGIAAAMSMALGTALSIMVVATVVTHAREKILSINADSHLTRWRYASKAAMLLAGILLLLFASVLFFSVIPISNNGDFVAAGC